MATLENASAAPMTLISMGIAFWTTVPTATGMAAPPAPPRPPRPLPAAAEAAAPSSPAHAAHTRSGKVTGKMRNRVRMTKYQSTGIWADFSRTRFALDWRMFRLVDQGGAGCRRPHRSNCLKEIELGDRLH